MKHDTTHDGLLERALTGTGSAASAETLRSCPECRDRLAELRQLEAELRADAAQEREFLAGSRDATAADETAVGEALERGRRARPHRPWRFRLLLLAVAACFVALLALREGLPKETPAAKPEVSLGGDFAVRIQVAAGRYDTVAWDCELSPGESFELSFEELEGEGVGRVLHTLTGSTGTSFVPPPELERSLPERVHVVVLVRDVHGLPRAQASATASRR